MLILIQHDHGETARLSLILVLPTNMEVKKSC